MTRPGYAASSPKAARKWLAVFALLSFFLQSLAVQTHIHPQPFAVQKASGTSAPTPVKNQDPVDQCQLCQELFHAGKFIAPSIALILGSLDLAPAILVALAIPKDHSAPAFAWQGRAPPLR